MKNWKETHNQKLRSKGLNITAVGDYITKGNTRQDYICDKGHKFNACRTYIIRSKGCPECNGGNKRWTDQSYRDYLKSINSVLTPIEPFIGTQYKIKHECNKGHIRLVQASAAIRGGGCAVCAGVAKKTTEEYEKELFDKCLPFHICDEYDGVMKKVAHQCLECDNVWDVRPHDILHGNGCPKCAKTGFNPYRPAKLYYVELTNETGRTLWKVGVTGKKNILHRFRAEKLRVKLIWEREYERGEDALRDEQLILSIHKADLAYAPDFLKLGGKTELFQYNVLKKSS